MVDSAKGKAEDVRAGFDTLRVLVDAVDTQLGFFIREKGMLALTVSLSGLMRWISRPCSV